MSVVCAVSRRALPTWQDPSRLPRPLRGHAVGCLRCQAEGAVHRGIRRELGRLGTVTVPAPPAVAGAVAASMGREGRGPVRRRGWPVAAALTGVAVAAGGAATVLARRRTRLAG